MKIGLMTAPRESAEDTVAIARMAEDHGIESIWLALSLFRAEDAEPMLDQLCAALPLSVGTAS
jgi:hypothetical protein